MSTDQPQPASVSQAAKDATNPYNLALRAFHAFTLHPPGIENGEQVQTVADDIKAYCSAETAALKERVKELDRDLAHQRTKAIDFHNELRRVTEQRDAARAALTGGEK